MSRLAVQGLRACGFQSIDIFAPRGVPLPDNDYVVRHRCDAGMSESGLFIEAIRSVHGNFVRQTDFVLYIRADVCLWQDAKLLMEHTIEPNFVAIYYPFAPTPFFLADERPLSCSQRGAFGWCAVPVDQPMAGAPCFACNKHTAMLLAGAESWVAGRSAVGLPWDQSNMVIARSLELSCYAHTPSLGYIGSPVDNETVPLDCKLDPRFTERKLYLN